MIDEREWQRRLDRRAELIALRDAGALRFAGHVELRRLEDSIQRKLDDIDFEMARRRRDLSMLERIACMLEAA